MSKNLALKTPPTVVGVGASAGGLLALKTFFAGIPADSGLVFVVVVHLSPEHESHLADLLQPHARFPVEQVGQTTSLEPNRAYIIPPNANISTVDSHLRLTDLERNRIHRAPIDHFFRTLASTHDGNAVGVILSGTGTDGTLGIKDIKAKGGLIIVQDPGDAEYDGMPRSAIATGMADLVLPVKEIPGAILRYDRTEPHVNVPDEDQEPAPDEHMLLQKIFAHLRTRTGRDFSRYKRTTIMRRIARRMQLNFMEDLRTYLDKLSGDPQEVSALADDLLITVTSFFRDPEVFEVLQERVLPSIIESKGPNDVVRAWSVGCATGEEAYSIAMLLLEWTTRLGMPPQIQVFGSDLHKRSLDQAREGFYQEYIEADVSEERLKRFFIAESNGYRIAREVRDLVVFTPHNLLGDPPFSRLDLIVCRNLLIYLERDMQRAAVELFHYALNPEGVLVLGSAETLDAADLFRSEDKKLCLYRKRNVPAPQPRLPVFPLTKMHFPAEVPAKIAAWMREPVAYGHLHQRMVELYTPPSVLVSADDKLLHLSESAGRFLVHPGGEPTANIVKLVREELRTELQGLLQISRDKKEVCASPPIPVRFNGYPVPVVMHVGPARWPEQEGFALIIFEERERVKPAAAVEADAPPELIGRIRELENELDLTRRRLGAVIEEYEKGREEMRASNEEMQSTNEELRSTMEELETSKEELQSSNEELQTVNQENRHKVEELAQLSSDLQNLLSATGIATLFLDRNLRILRFTPKVTELFNVRVVDRGRPISDLTHRLGYSELQTDALSVLKDLKPVEREMQDDAGRWYLTRMLPYRSAEDRIEGLVITFVDISQRRAVERSLLAHEGNLRQVNETLSSANADLKQFAIAVSHDLREPLRTVASYAQLLIEATQLGHTEEASLALRVVQGSLERMDRMLKDLLAYTQVSVDEQGFAEVLDLNVAAQKAIDNLRSKIEEANAEIVVDALPEIRGREVHFMQLLQNLIDNAIKYRSERRPEVTISADRIGQEWRVAVKDNGIGIDPVYQNRIFEVFTRLHDSKLSGNGIGLAVCRRVVDRNGGRIWVESQPGSGSVFYFTVPVR